MNQLLDQALEFFRADFPDLEYVKEVKSGKEATVYLVQTDEQLMALKLYRQYAQNSERMTYMKTDHLDRRTKLALNNKSSHGRGFERSSWTRREFDMLQQAAQAGVLVPEVYAHNNEAILMEWLGSGEEPAPRLSDVKLTTEQSQRALNSILKAVELFWDLGFVHGDLSAFNVLWHKDQPYIIDFPQALDAYQNRSARERYHRDVENITRYLWH